MAVGTKGRQYATLQTHFLRKDISYTDDGVTVTVGYLPPGAIVVSAGVVVSTAFNAGTGNVLDIGTSGDGDGFATDLALGTIGNIVWDELATSNDLYATTEVQVTADVALTGTAATAGTGHVYVEFIPADPAIASTA
jgi:hypothetical protein